MMKKDDRNSGTTSKVGRSMQLTANKVATTVLAVKDATQSFQRTTGVVADPIVLSVPGVPLRKI